MGPLVDVEWLAEHERDPAIRIADVRWYLPSSGRNGRTEYEAGHIPGAVFVDLDRDLADPPCAALGRHPLPSPERFAGAMARTGIGSFTQVVAYDDAGGAIAARLWWLLRYFGHRGGVAILDGGLGAWAAARKELDRSIPTPSPAEFVPRPASTGAIDIDQVNRRRAEPGLLLLDARSVDRYEGRTEPIDARPGHIPSARSAPFAENLKDGRFRATSDLRARFEALGATRAEVVVCYCGSGVTACHDILALELAGFSGALLYAGSYSQWAARSELDVAVGPEPHVVR